MNKAPLRKGIHRRGAGGDEASQRNLRGLSLLLSARPLRTLRLCGEEEFPYFPKTIWHVAYTVVFLAFVSLTTFAQQRPLITEDVQTVKPGAVRFEAGFDFLQDKDYPVSGLNGDLARLGVVSPSMKREMPRMPSLPTIAISAEAPSSIT